MLRKREPGRSQNQRMQNHCGGGRVHWSFGGERERETVARRESTLFLWGWERDGDQEGECTGPLGGGKETVARREYTVPLRVGEDGDQETGMVQAQRGHPEDFSAMETGGLRSRCQ